MSAPKECPHRPIEASYAWCCDLCGHRLLELRRLGRLEWWTERRTFRRLIDEWSKGE